MACTSPWVQPAPPPPSPSLWQRPGHLSPLFSCQLLPRPCLSQAGPARILCSYDPAPHPPASPRNPIKLCETTFPNAVWTHWKHLTSKHFILSFCTMVDSPKRGRVCPRPGRLRSSRTWDWAGEHTVPGSSPSGRVSGESTPTASPWLLTLLGVLSGTREPHRGAGLTLCFCFKDRFFFLTRPLPTPARFGSTGWMRRWWAVAAGSAVSGLRGFRGVLGPAGLCPSSQDMLWPGTLPGAAGEALGWLAAWELGQESLLGPPGLHGAGVGSIPEPGEV